MTTFSVSLYRQTVVFDDREIARVSGRTILEAAVDVDSRDAQLLFTSCTGQPAVDVIAQIVRHIGKSVLTSNHAGGRAMARHRGPTEHAPVRYGRVFEYPLPACATGKSA